MCKLKVVLDNKMVFGECIYAKQEDNDVIMKDVLGFKQRFINVTILEVDVGRETLTLRNLK